MDVKLFGTMKKCEDCELSKSRKNNVNKGNFNRRKIKGEILYTYIRYIMNTSYGVNNYWILIVDEDTLMKWFFFYKKNRDIGEIIGDFVDNLKNNMNIEVIWISSDNTGENRKIQSELNKNILHTSVEFTEP